MLRRALIAITILVLGGCSTIAADEAERCHGVRRPANPNGSVLALEAAPVDPAALGTAPAGPCAGSDA